jgi:hypothetical protein
MNIWSVINNWTHSGSSYAKTSVSVSRHPIPISYISPRFLSSYDHFRQIQDHNSESAQLHTIGIKYVHLNHAITPLPSALAHTIHSRCLCQLDASICTSSLSRLISNGSCLSTCNAITMYELVVIASAEFQPHN